MRNVVDVLGVFVDRDGFSDVVDKTAQFLNEGTPRAVYTPNPEIIMHAYRNPWYKELLNRGDVVVPDGIGVVIASKILNKPVKERVAGFDVTCRLLEYAGKNGKKVYVYGGKEENCKAATVKIKEKFGAEVCGYTNGYITDDKAVALDIKNKGADMVLVCLGAPKQEVWIDKYKNIAGAKLYIGAGGSVDVLADAVRRAPDIFIKLNLEWFYRLCKQPKRFIRMLDLPLFIFKILTVGKRQK